MLFFLNILQELLLFLKIIYYKLSQSLNNLTFLKEFKVLSNLIY